MRRSFAKGKFARYHGMLEQKFVSASALDAKGNTMNANRAKFEHAKANLAVARNQAGYATLAAPENSVTAAVIGESGRAASTVSARAGRG